jgi:hypothetical protein
MNLMLGLVECTFGNLTLKILSQHPLEVHRVETPKGCKDRRPFHRALVQAKGYTHLKPEEEA